MNLGLLGLFSENTKEILAIGFVHSGPKDHILGQSDKLSCVNNYSHEKGGIMSILQKGEQSF